MNMNRSTQAQDFGYKGGEEALKPQADEEVATTLLVRHLPEAIPHDTIFRLFAHYGAFSVRPCAGGRLRNCVFVDFKDEALASQAQSQLNRLRFLGKVLSVERANKHKNQRNEAQRGGDLTSLHTSLQKDIPLAGKLTSGANADSLSVGEPIAARLGVEYAYPPPDGNILTNIVNALIAVPRFYTQVLHLMNKMNIPAPFRMALPTPPLPSSVATAPPPPPPPPPPVVAKPCVADLSSDESELESSEEGDGDDRNYSFGDSRIMKRGRKRARREAIVGPAIDKEVAHEAVGLKPSTLVPKEIPVIKKNNPVLKIKIASKPVQNEPKHDYETEESVEQAKEDLELKSYAMPEEIESAKLPPEEILSLPMFKNYTAGNPSTVLYIKNLAKDVVPEDFYFIFGSLFGSLEAAKSGLNVKLMQLDSALKASERAQALLHTERANSRTLMFTEAEFKSLQLQVREMNLLRESNMQLREENKHNFEECQKLREEAQQASVEINQFKTLLREKQIELDAYHKEIEMQKIEKEQLEKRVSEVLEKCKNIDVEDYDHMKDAFHLMQIKLQEKEAEVEETKRLVSEKQDIITRLEQELTNTRSDLTEKEKRIVDIELDKQKKALPTYYKKKLDELTKEKQVLSQQLEVFRQGKRPVGDAITEKAMKEKEKEKDTRIQMLEKTLEREREDNRKEKAKRQKSEKAVCELLENFNQEKKKLVDEFEKYKHAKDHLPESSEASGAQLPSESALDERMAAYLTALEHLEESANSNFGDPLAARTLPVETSSLVETSPTVASGRMISAQAPATQPSLGGTVTSSRGKTTDVREKRASLPKPGVETRKAGRKLIRPHLGRPQEPTVDVEMSEMEGPSNSEETKSAPKTETQGDSALPTQPATRKRMASSPASEFREESLIQQETSSDVQAQVLKKSRGSDSPQEGAEVQLSVPGENLQTITAVEESFDAACPCTTNEDAIDTEKDVEEYETKEHAEEPREPPSDITNQIEAQIDTNIVAEESSDKARETDEAFDNGQPKEVEVLDPQQSMMEAESEKEEGELVPDVEQPPVEGDMIIMVNSPEPIEGSETVIVSVTPAVAVDEEAVVSTAVDAAETTSIEVLNDEKIDGDGVDQMEETADGSDKSTNDQGSDKPNNDHEISETEQSSKGASSSADISLPAVPTDSTTKHGVSAVLEPDEAKVDSKSTTINLSERARQKAAVRQAGMLSPSPSSRGRARSGTVLRNRGSRGGRGGRGGRGQVSGEQE